MGKRASCSPRLPSTRDGQHWSFGLRLWLFLALGILFHMVKGKVYQETEDRLTLWDFPSILGQLDKNSTGSMKNRSSNDHFPSSPRPCCFFFMWRANADCVYLIHWLRNFPNFLISLNVLSESSSHFLLVCDGSYAPAHSFILSYFFFLENVTGSETCFEL